MLRKALVVLSGNAAASLLLLARNLIVARMIPVSDYGVASTFAMAMAVVEMASSFGLQQQIVQAKEGDDPRFQAVLQGFQVLRGVVSGLVLFAIAVPLARFMGIPDVAWAYQVLALVPVLNALQHFDIHRLNRQMRFGPMLLSGAVPAAVSLVLVWPLAAWLGDWKVMLWSIMAQAALTVITGHLLAERPYRLAFDTAIISRSLRFGWPLLVNAVLMFLVFQGDKLIVGRVLGMEPLAIFSMGVTLTLTPTLVLAKSAQNLFLPRLSALEGSSDFSHTALLTMQIVIFMAVLFSIIVLLAATPVLTPLLGEKYAALYPLMIWFALGQALRVMKAGPAIVALSLGRTSNAMISNGVRVVFLLLAWLAANQGYGMLVLLWIALAAEAIGLALSVWLVLSHSPLPRRPVLVQHAATLLVIFVIAVFSYITPATTGFFDWTVWLICASNLAILLWAMPEMRRALLQTRHT